MFKKILLRLSDFLLRKLDIREGEFRRVWLMQLTVFLLIQSLWIIKPVVNAQFLSRMGIEKLPSAFLLVALTALLVSFSYSRLLTRLPLGKIMIRTYMVSIGSLLMIGTLLYFQLFEDWLSYLFYIGTALFGLITTSQFWLLGNLVFNSLAAKRLFGFIGAGAIAGGISGGYLTSTLASVMASEYLLFIAAGFLMISMVISYKIWLTFVPASDQSIQVRPSRTFEVYPFRLIRNSKHLTFLALIMGISVIVDKLVEFQFSSIASSRIVDPDRLTAFFGFWFSTSNVASLVIQLLVTQRLIALLGVGRSLFIFPGALFTGAAVVLNTPVLWAGTALKMIDISLKQSINKAATELLILPIPMSIKGQAKTFIDVFIDTTATGIGGIILIFIVNGLHLSVRAVCIMILTLIGAWIYFAVRVRKEYVKTFQEKLGIDGKIINTRNSDADVIKSIQSTLQDGTTKQIIFLLGRIEESKDAALMPHTIPLLNHDSPKVRQAVLRCLYYHTDHSITTRVEPLLRDPDDEVRSRAFSCLLAHTRQDRVRFIEEYLGHPDPAISGAALVGLATEARDNPQLQKKFNLEQRIQEKINHTSHLQDNEEIQAHKTLILRVIGYGKVEFYYPLLKAGMEDKDHIIKKQAILAVGSTQDPSFINTLLALLPQKSTRSPAQKALAKFEPSKLLPILMDIISGKKVGADILKRLPALANTMDTQEAIDYLFEAIQNGNIAVRTEALEVLHTMKVKFPHLIIRRKRILHILHEEYYLYTEVLGFRQALEQKMSNEKVHEGAESTIRELILLLEQKRVSILKQIFLALGLTYSHRLGMQLFKDLQSEDHTIRINTVELLDNLLKPAQKRIVMPIVETAILDTLSEDNLGRLELKIPAEYAMYQSILTSDDPQLKWKVLALLTYLDDATYIPLIRMAADDDQPKVKMMAEEWLMKKEIKEAI